MRGSEVRPLQRAHRRRNTWAAALLIALLLPACAGAQPGPTHDLVDIIGSGKLRVAVTHFDLPAFHWRSQESFDGPEIEMAQAIGRALGVEVEFVDDATSFNGVVDAIAQGRADIGISKLSQTYARLKRVRFSEAYITLQHALLFDRAAIAARGNGLPPDQVLRKFNGRLGVIQGSSYVDFARRNFPAARIVEMADWGSVTQGLLAGKVEAIYRDEFEIRRVLKGSPALNVRLGAAVVTDQKDYLSVAICDSCSKLQEFINHHLTRTRGVFTVQRLLAGDLHDKADK